MGDSASEIEARYLGMVPGARAPKLKPDGAPAGPKRRGKKPQRWSVRQVCEKCSAAPVVYLALLEMARERGSRVVTPTRDTLSERTGIVRKPTISAALSALAEARWIRRDLVPVSVGSRTAARLLRITVITVSNAERSLRRDSHSNAERSLRRESRK